MAARAVFADQKTTLSKKKAIKEMEKVEDDSNTPENGT